MKKISVIIPVYNVEKYLKRCLESLVYYENIYEIILIDDGSTDDSLKICHDYKKKFSKIQVIHQKNQGPSAARNTGILNATGDYIWFIDSDDFVTEEIKKVFDKVEKIDSDMYIFTYNLYNGREKKVANILDDQLINLKSNYKIIKKMVISEKINSLCTKIYKNKIIQVNQIKLNESINLAEDLLFNLEYLTFTKNVYFLDIACYNYCYNDYNSITKKYNKLKYETLMKANELIYPYLDKLNSKKLINYLIYKNLFSVIYDLHNSNCNYSYKEKKEFIKKIKRKHSKNIIFDCGLQMFMWTVVYSFFSSFLIYHFSKYKHKIDVNCEKYRNKKVSVVIPIYKVESYLEKCLDSIINQTYSNLEIILVDDGSPDNCGKICDDYAKYDTRIKVIHKKNGGLSDARNFGLDIATGEYICFVDSDDYVDKQYIEKLVFYIVETDSDISVCDFLYINEEGKKWSRKEKKNKIYNSVEAIKDIFSLEQNTEVMVWNKLYKRSLFIDNNIKFPVGRIHEDNFTTYRLYDKAKKIILFNDRLYYYLQRSNSIMSTFNEKKFDILIAVSEIKKYFKNRPEIEQERQCNELLCYLSLMNGMIKSDYQGKEKNKIRNLIIKNKKIYLKNKIIPLQKKIMVNIISKDIDLYKKIFLMLKK